MRKKLLLLLIPLIIMLIPIPYEFGDGGSVRYQAVLYSVTKYHALNYDQSTEYFGFTQGVRVTILGVNVYENFYESYE